MMARQVVDQEKLTEAQEAAGAAMEAADAAMEAATLAAEKVAELAETAEPTSEGQGDGGTGTGGPRGHDGSGAPGGRDATPEGHAMSGQAAAGRHLDGDGMADGYRIIRNGPQDFSVEGIFRQDGSQRYRRANGFPSAAAARLWIKAQLAEGR